MPEHTHPTPEEEPHPSGEATAAAVTDHELLRVIGKGGYGEVWLARNTLGVYRAIKIVREKTFRDKRPFERELGGVKRFEPASRLHDGLMDILQVGSNEVGGYFYCVMELADNVESGQAIDPKNYSPLTLTQEAAKHKCLPVQECLRIGGIITSALGFLHRRGLIHRDVKPSNIVFVNGVPKLADIGLVAELADAKSYVGTDGFIPPEGPGTIQADLYSLGKVLYEISTGKDRRDFPELPTALNETVHERELVELNKIILKACRTDPRERYGSADEMLEDLLAVQRGESVRLPQKKPLKRVMWAAGLACLSLTGLVMFSRGRKPLQEEVMFVPGASQRIKTAGPARVASGLIAWWPAEDNAIDSVSGASAWVMNGARVNAEGMVGKSFDFDGIDDHIRVANRPELCVTGPMTIEGWVCQRTNGSMQTIFSKWDAVANVEQRSFSLGCLQSGRISFGVSPAGISQGCESVLSTTALPLNQWTHVAATYDGNYLRVYVNGMKAGQVTYTNGIFPGTNEMTIGAVVDYSDGKLLVPFAGRIDELSVYDRSLSEAEIRAICDARELGKRLPPTPAPEMVPPGLVGWWRAEGDANDSANGHHGTLKNGASFAFGKIGQAFSFDGVDDYVMIPKVEDLDVGKELTIDFWMKADPNNFMDGLCQGLVSSDFYSIEIAPGDTLTRGINFAVITEVGVPLNLQDPKYPKPSLGITSDINGRAAVISSGEWHYIAGTYDGSVLQLYVDGKPWGDKTVHGGTIFPMWSESFLAFGSEDGRTFCPFCIGKRYFKGLLDEVRIFNRALSAEEISATYHAVVGVKSTQASPVQPAR